MATNQKDCEITYSDVLHKMQFSPDGSHVLLGGFHPDVLIYDAKTGHLAQTLSGHKNGTFGSFSPDGRTIFSISHKTARLWNAATELEIVQLDATQIASPFQSPGFTPDGNGLYVYLVGGKSNTTTRFRFLTLPTLEQISKACARWAHAICGPNNFTQRHEDTKKESKYLLRQKYRR